MSQEQAGLDQPSASYQSDRADNHRG